MKILFWFIIIIFITRLFGSQQSCLFILTSSSTCWNIAAFGGVSIAASFKSNDSVLSALIMNTTAHVYKDAQLKSVLVVKMQIPNNQTLNKAYLSIQLQIIIHNPTSVIINNGCHLSPTSHLNTVWQSKIWIKLVKVVITFHICISYTQNQSWI